MQTVSEPRFKIGTKFKSRGFHPKECRITDILRTYTDAGELVRVRYVAVHEFMGQQVVDHDVCDTTIATGLIKSVEE